MAYRDADHRALARWAADCGAHVLAIFEAVRPRDRRPRRAIEAARAWIRGEGNVTAVRAAAVAGHAAARAVTDPAARAAARACATAAATCHARGHAPAAALYASRAVTAAAAARAAAAAARTAAAEHAWQARRLPRHLRAAVAPIWKPPHPGRISR